MKRPYLLMLSLFFLINVSWSQKTASPDKIQSLKNLPQNKNAKVAASRFASAYSFEVTGENLSVVNYDAMDLISLKGNLNYIRHIFYNDNISILENDIRYTTGKTVRKENACGNYEVESIFYSDAKVCSYGFNFLHEGTEIVFKSKSKYSDPKYLTKVFFHDDVPVETRELTFTVPESVNIELVERNFEGYEIKKTTNKKDGKTIYTYTAKGLKAIKSEPNSLGTLHHYPHLIVLTKEYTSASGKKKMISSVDDLYRWYSGLVKEVKNNPSSFEDFVKTLVANAKTPEEKIKSIYYWVQDNIKYVAFEDGIAGFRPEPAQNVYANRYGDCKGMANLTREMLKVAGFDARLTWIGTNRIPYNYDIPSLAVDNHMICTVYNGDNQYILDPTEKYIALGKHAERIQGKEMLIENGEGFIRKKVPESDFKANLVSRTETIILEGDLLKGQGEVSVNGEAKKNILYFSNQAKLEDQRKIFDKLAVTDYTNADKVEVINTPPMDREKPLEVKYTYILNNKVSKFDKDIYLDFDWNKTYGDLQIEEDRESDYYFNRKVWLKTTKKIKVPQGYKVTHLPKAMNKQHPDFSFEVSFKQVGSEIVYSNEITVKQGIVKKSNFELWNSYVKELKDIYSDQIVLTKTK